MKLTDDTREYGLVSIINHWLVAAFVIVMLSIGIYMGEVPEEQEQFWAGLHVSVGGTAALFIIFRVLWRLFSPTPASPSQSRPLEILAKAVHHLLLLAIVVMIITGPLTVWTKGYPVNIFDLVVLPSLTGEMEDLSEILGEIHEFTAWSIIVLLSLHILGTLKHVIIDRDNTLARILGKTGSNS